MLPKTPTKGMRDFLPKEFCFKTAHFVNNTKDVRKFRIQPH